jgi:uncharacterized membrane protein YfcA
MCAGSVPMAFLGAYLLHLLGGTSAQQGNVEIALGAALLAGTAAMLLRSWLDRKSGRQRTAGIGTLTVRPVVTLLIGAVGGLIVGMTSVGSGSLMIVLLLFAYPLLGASEIVGTDLTQAVPLTAAAALGALAFGHVEFGLTTGIIVGSVPAVFVGSLLSSRAPDKYIRPVITFVIFASGLKYAGMATNALAWTLGAAIVLCGAYRLASYKSDRFRTIGSRAADARRKPLPPGGRPDHPRGDDRPGPSRIAGAGVRTAAGDPRGEGGAAAPD